MSYLRTYPIFSILALIAASITGCFFASIAAYMTYLRWIAEGTQGMSDPVRSAVNFGTSAFPGIVILSLLIGIPALLVIKRLSFRHLLFFTLLATTPGAAILIGPSAYWGPTIFCFGFFTALSACTALMVRQKIDGKNVKENII